jgi:hypothetical protein
VKYGSIDWTINYDWRDGEAAYRYVARPWSAGYKHLWGSS